jgi:hypothetical protein
MTAAAIQGVARRRKRGRDRRARGQLEAVARQALARKPATRAAAN